MKKLTSFDIKFIAFTLMIIDHAGRFFWPQSLIPIALGRLSFPLFAWLASMGERHTTNLKKYLRRLIILGTISQPIYAYTYHLLFSVWAPLNILFTLAFGVGLIAILKRIHVPILKLIALTLGLMLAEIIHVEGGAYAVMTIYLMSLFRRDSVRWYILFISINLIFIAVFRFQFINIINIFSPIFLFLYNGRRGYKARWFYFLYPFHFGVLIVLQRLFFPGS